MKKTAAWLVRYALEELSIKFTFGIPGVHNTEIYDELEKSSKINPILVTHEGYGAFMADAVSRSSDSIGALVIVPAAGVTHAASGIGEAFLDGIPMLIISGGVRTDSKFSYQLHDMNQHEMLKPITKATFKVESHQEVVSTIYEAYSIATQGEPGPVFVEIPVNLQLDLGSVDSLPSYVADTLNVVHCKESDIDRAVELLLQAKNPGIFVGWGGVEASEETKNIAELIASPVATTLQGLSAFPYSHPLHTGMGMGIASVPAAYNAFKSCDCLLAIGTRFAEIATGSFGVNVPENLIHLDINPKVFHANFPAKVTLEGDSKPLLAKILEKLSTAQSNKNKSDVSTKKFSEMKRTIASDKKAYQDEWLNHATENKVNPAYFFKALREQLNDDAYVIADDGNHTFLTAELMPCYQPKHFFSPTDFNCMGYAIPAVVGTKLANPANQVVGIIGDGAFLMSHTELFTASHLRLGGIFIIFNDGELAQISQAQQTPYNKKTCTVLPNVKFKAISEAAGCEYLAIDNNEQVLEVIQQAISFSDNNVPVVIDVNIDYSKQTRFTQGIIKTNLKRMKLPTKTRMISRALWRRI